jgi:hypothetical protein
MNEKRWLFTEDYKNRVLEKFKSLDELERPFIYHLVTKNSVKQYNPLCQSIEYWLDNIGDANRKKFLNKFRNLNNCKENFIQIVNELGIGFKLNSLGFEVDYEKIIDNRFRPDWVIKTNNSEVNFLVEVFTSNPSYENDNIKKKNDLFISAIEKIPIGVCLLCDYYDNYIFKIECFNKIYSDLHAWLKLKPRKDSFKIINDIRFEIIGYDSRLRNVECSLFGPIWKIKGDSIVNNIRSKLYKYRNVPYPLIISVVSSPQTARNEDSIANVILGQLKVNIINRKLLREKNGIFHDITPKLSAIIWTWGFGLSNWELEVFRNPKSEYPISENVLGKDYKFL